MLPTCRAVFLIVFWASSFAVLAADPGDRAFTALGGASFGGSAPVGSGGNLAVSLPLLLPLPRGGLPLLFTVSYTGSNVVGAAGLGWDIPIAAVTWQHNLSRRKPLHRFEGQVDPSTADRVFVNIGNGPMLMAPGGTPGAYQPFANGYFDLKFVRSSFVGRDASGRTWIFQQFPALFDDDYFPLVSIIDAGGTNRVDFHYDIFDRFSSTPIKPPYDPHELSIRELLLRAITHSYDVTGACPKYRIDLDYTNGPSLDYPVPYPGLLGLEMDSARPRAHTKLLRNVSVRSNSNTLCLSSGDNTELTERTFQIKYAPDALTGQPRLTSVDMLGVDDAGSNPNTALPVVAYQYGSPLVANELNFATAEQLLLPAAPPVINDGFAASYGTEAGGLYGLVRGFQDFNGDGRADFLTLDASGAKPVLFVNRPSSLGNDYSTLDGPVDLPNDPAAPYNLGAPDLAFNLPVVATIDNTYQQVIDFNGDGRPDIIVATDGRNPSGARDPNYWKILINTPGPSGNPGDIVWLERHVDVAALRATIQNSQPDNNTTSSTPTVVGEWVYFRGTDNKLWRMRTDGSAQNVIGNNTTASTPFVTPGGWVYFRGTDDKLWKVRTDGTGQLQIGNNTTSSTPFVTPDGWVWFRGTDDKLWKVFNDGTQQSQPGNNTTSSSPTVVGEWVYFRGTDNKLWRMRTDGSAQNVIGSNTTSSTPFVTPDGWIWFQGTDDRLWKVFNDGTQQSQPGNNTTLSTPTVVGEWAYFRGTDNKLWRMRTDGSAQNVIGNNTTSSTPFVTSDGWVWFQGTDDRLLRVFREGTPHVLSPVASTDENSKPLPVSRTHQVGAFDSTTVIESGVITQWKLLDVNGDGFPDFVFDSSGVSAWTEQQCDAANICKEIVRQDRQDNHLMVIYHTGPMMAGSGADTQNVWRGPAVVLRTDGACGVERLVWMGGGRRQLSCGFMEADGDGLVDYVISDSKGIRAIRSSGLAEAHDVRLPENQIPADYSQHEAKRAIVLPGPVGVVKDPRSSICTTNVADDQHYDIEQQTALRDITGDGIADYIYFGSRGALADGTPLSHPALVASDRDGPQGWWFMAGTGVGFAPPRAIRTPPELSFTLHVSKERCDGLYSNVTATLFDVDGDGRPELIRVVRPGNVRIAKLVDEAGSPGAHGSGLLTAIDNRYGSQTRITYGSAKSSWVSGGGVPFPQIVVTQTEQTAERGLGSPLAPVRYAYGSPELLYHPLLGRWVFAGFRRRVELIGETTSTFNQLKGMARVSISLGASEAPGDLAQLMLTGRSRDTNLFTGSSLPADPRHFLGDSGLMLPGANMHTTWRTQALPASAPLLVSLDEECYAPPPVQTPGIFGDLALCRRTAAAYIAERSDWEGTHPYPSTDSVATRTAIAAVDDYARPTRIIEEGDRSRTDDDVCIHIDYASPVQGAPIILNAPHTVRAYECNDDSRTLAGVRYQYDGLTDGLVGNGLPSGRVLERHNAQTGELLEQVQSAALARDVFGNPIRFTRTRPDGASATTELVYDSFGLVPVRTETSATGLAMPLISEVERDGNTLLPLTLTNEHGTSTHNSYDGFGRLIGVSLSLPGDATRYALFDTEFLGFDGSPGGRVMRHHLFHRWTPESLVGSVDPATVTTYTEPHDELGRKMHGIFDLGADYGGISLVVDSTLYDELGRPRFVPDLFPNTTFAAHYGTTFTYRADGRPECLIDGVNLQQLVTTDEAVDRYPTCFSYSYANGQFLIRTQGPNELAVGKPQSGAYDEEALSATRAVLHRSRWQNGSKLQWIEYGYDRLGALSNLTRWADPQATSGAVSWWWVNDSLGNVLTASEPAGVSRSYTYDTWGNLTGVHWQDNAGIASVDRGLSFQFDGLSRLLRTQETQNGEGISTTLKEYFYDTSSGKPQHLDTQYLLGQLSYARADGRSVFLGYDALGRLTTLSRSDQNESAFYAERSILGPSGDIEGRALLLPDNNGMAEQIRYDYDSARRLRAIQFQDISGNTELWRALETDLFGRVLQSQFGNGATETYAYRLDRRRELLSHRTVAGSRSRVISYNGYDGGMLLQGISELTTLETSASTATNYSYDARNALVRATTQNATGVIADTNYAYDGLGNLLSLTDNVGSASTEIRPDPIDRDRICAVATPGSPETPCSYRYDASGNVWQIHDTDALFSYDGASRLRAAQQGDRQAQMDYDAFGSLASLRVRSGNLERHERFYGRAGARVDFFDATGNPVTVGNAGMMFQNFIERQIDSPVGTVAVIRRSNTGNRVILYPVGDYQGTRAVLGGDGNTAETISYTAYGSVLSDSGSPDSLTWWPHQWNGGQVLDGFGLVALGQRVLDPRLGRFLQRDPIMNGRSSITAHPYAFAWNNPVAFIDRTGAQPQGDDNTGGIATGLAAFGKLVTSDPAEPGEQVDRYIEMRWACNADHDCISAVESTYPLTNFEKSLREQYHRPWSQWVTKTNAYGNLNEYRIIMDRLSGAVVGYAFEMGAVDTLSKSMTGKVSIFLAALGASKDP